VDTRARTASERGELFRHVSAERATLYRAILDVFAAAKRQFRPHLRPDEVRAESRWSGPAPEVDTVQQALTQLAEWGNLQAQPDTARVTTVEDFYRARFLYRLSPGGEAVESALEAFDRALARQGELQSVALEDILARLEALESLARAEPVDAARVHESLRDLVHVFTGLADNAQAFMTGVARSLDVRRGDVSAVMAYKDRLMAYLDRFIGDLVTRSGRIARHLERLEPRAEKLLVAAAAREARDAAPGDAAGEADAHAERLAAWRERWTGLRRWFLSEAGQPSQSERLRARARSAIPALLAAIAEVNERRSGRSDRAADYRTLARWFAETGSDRDAHRLARAAFAVAPARHLALRAEDTDVAASTRWVDGPSVDVHPRLRERGRLTRRGAPPRARDRSRERALLARTLADEQAHIDASRRRFATGRPLRLSALGTLDRHELSALLAFLGDSLAAQRDPESAVERPSADGVFRVRLEPLGEDERARIETRIGTLEGRDHLLTVTAAPNDEAST
jgi:uncharacterized protein (TIGR02677 family)